MCVKSAETDIAPPEDTIYLFLWVIRSQIKGVEGVETDIAPPEDTIYLYLLWVIRSQIKGVEA
eukprot:2364166-Pyramimonas_sp.AAC.1